MKCKRNLETTHWYVVASPVHVEIIIDMRTNNNFITNSCHKIRFAPYDNSQAVDTWASFENTALHEFVYEKGYAAKLAAIGTAPSTWKINTSDISITWTQGAVSGPIISTF